jgi:hydroxypyruvate reductase
MSSVMTMIQDETRLRRMLEAAIAAASPASAIAAHLPPAPVGRTIVLGAGKAAAAMAQEVERHMAGPIEGLVVTRYGHGVPCQRIEVVEAAHPVPDAAGQEAAARMLELATSAGPDDLVLCLMSGGASALLALPAAGISLDDKQALNRALLASGADIGQMNTVRKHLSAIKGGRLAAAAHPARVVSLMISDVPRVARDHQPLAAAGRVLPVLALRAARIGALVHIGLPFRPPGRLALARAAHGGVAAIGELGVLAWAAERARNQHLEAQCQPGIGPAPFSSSSAPVSKRSRLNASFNGCGASLAMVWANTQPEPGVALKPP